MLQNLHVLLTFDKVNNPLRLPRETTSERPKVLQTPQIFIPPKKSTPLSGPPGVRQNHFLDSLSAGKDMQLQVPDFGEGTCCSWLKL